MLPRKPIGTLNVRLCVRLPLGVIAVILLIFLPPTSGCISLALCATFAHTFIAQRAI